MRLRPEGPRDWNLFSPDRASFGWGFPGLPPETLILRSVEEIAVSLAQSIMVNFVFIIGNLSQRVPHPLIRGCCHSSDSQGRVEQIIYIVLGVYIYNTRESGPVRCALVRV